MRSGGKVVLFTAYGAAYQDVRIVAQVLATGQRKVLIEGGASHAFLPRDTCSMSSPMVAGTLMAIAFNPRQLAQPPYPGLLTAKSVLTIEGLFIEGPGKVGRPVQVLTT